MAVVGRGKDVRFMNVDVMRQLNEIPPTWIVEQLEAVYGKEIWDNGVFVKLDTAGIKVPEKIEQSTTREFFWTKCSCHHDFFRAAVMISKRHFRDNKTSKMFDFWFGRCENCGKFYWEIDRKWCR